MVEKKDKGVNDKFVRGFNHAMLEEKNKIVIDKESPFFNLLDTSKFDTI